MFAKARENSVSEFRKKPPDEKSKKSKINNILFIMIVILSKFLFLIEHLVHYDVPPVLCMY